MKLYYSDTLNPRKACAVARYLNSPVEFVHVDLAKGEHKTPDYLAINPNGKVPALTDGDLKIWESNAIMCHLARKAGSDLWPRDDDAPARSDALADLEFGAFHPPRRKALFPIHHQAEIRPRRRTKRRSRKRPASGGDSPAC